MLQMAQQPAGHSQQHVAAAGSTGHMPGLYVQGHSKGNPGWKSTLYPKAYEALFLYN
jgi:hypothetical protein